MSQPESSANLGIRIGNVFISVFVPAADVGDFVFLELVIIVLDFHDVSPFFERKKARPKK